MRTSGRRWSGWEGRRLRVVQQRATLRTREATLLMDRQKALALSARYRNLNNAI